jgi:hypothetical protein
VRPVAAALLLALATAAPPAAADDTSDCIAASEAAQSLRDRRALLAAHDKLAVCSRDVCPGAIRADCIQQRGEVDAATPSVVFRARDAHAEDLVDVKVLCDGVVLATHVDGKAVAVDPGAHTFRFEAQGLPPVERKLVIGEGEKARLIVAEMQSGAPAVVVPAPVPPPPEPPNGLWLPGLVVGAVGVAAAVPMAIFWLSGTGDIHQMKGTCAPAAGGAGCPADRVDSDRTKLVLGDVFLGVAAAGIATGAVLLLTHRGSSDKELRGDATALRFDASPVPGGALVSAGARF